MEVEKVEKNFNRDNFFDRTERVLGAKAMKRMRGASVLIVGVGGLGCEIAKNITLTGVGKVTIADHKNVDWMDLSAQFYVTEDDIGKNRAVVSAPKIRELNPTFVNVAVHEGEVTEALIKEHQVAVFTEMTYDDVNKYNVICRKNNVKFVACDTRGLTGMTFTDFGDEHVVEDDNGEQPVSHIVTDITKHKSKVKNEEGEEKEEENWVVSVYEKARNHGLGEEDQVKFEGVEGLVGLNSDEANEKLFDIAVTGKHTFQLKGELAEKISGAFKESGYVYQVKRPVTKSYKSFEETLEEPAILTYDFGKFEHPQQLHAGFRALSDYVAENKELPKPYDEKDATTFFELTKKYGGSDETLLKKFAKTVRGNLNPMTTFFGGFAAQEAMKAISGKYTPCDQYFYFEAMECLPKEPTDVEPKKSRYDGQSIVFGHAFQAKLENLNYFMVGVGALGCEYLKNFACLGVACGEQGRLTITDSDNIEVSNLSRQFLFRRKHVGKSKSMSAAEVIRSINTDIHIDALEHKVCPENEHIFDDRFWSKLDGVTNALDNIHARLYVDGRCIYYLKSLMEAGTLGSQANTQIVIPHLTESYGSSRDPPETSIPICTLKNFPNAIEHTIQWARDIFEKYFVNIPTNIVQYATNENFIEEMKGENQGVFLDTLSSIEQFMVSFKPTTFEDCIRFARLRFEHYYNHIIRQLLFTCPLDKMTEDGQPFWGGPKKPPTPITFDATNKLHIDYIVACSMLYAEVHGLSRPSSVDRDFFSKAAAAVDVPPFQPNNNAKVATTEEEAKEEESSGNGFDDEISTHLSRLPAASSLSGSVVLPLDFEKDDDTNFHIDFITAASNLRASNYKIPHADRKKTKGIAGKIIPAMVTTTALITGLGMLEFYKIHQGVSSIESFKNSYVNLALPFCIQSDAIAPKKEKMGDQEFTLWDRILIDMGRDITIGELEAYFAKEHNLELSMMSFGEALIFSSFDGEADKRRAQTLKEAIVDITQKPFNPNAVFANLECCCDDLDSGDEVDIPFVQYKIQHFD